MNIHSSSQTNRFISEAKGTVGYLKAWKSNENLKTVFPHGFPHKFKAKPDPLPRSNLFFICRNKNDNKENQQVQLILETNFPE